MKTSATLAGAVIALAASATYAQNSINLRIVTAQEFDAGGNAIPGIGLSEDPIDVQVGADGLLLNGSDTYSATFYVQATLTDPNAISLTTFDARLTDDLSGDFGKGALTNTEALGFVVPGNDFLNRTGMFPTYRATIQNDNDNPGNGEFTGTPGDPGDPLTFEFLPLNLGMSPDGSADGFVNVYKFTWTTSNLNARTVELNLDTILGGYFTDLDPGPGIDADLVQPVPTVGDNFTITFIPAPGTFTLLALGGVAVTRRRR